MAKLSPEVRNKIINLKQQLLDAIDEAKKVDFAILERFGETGETLVALDQLAEIAEQARSRFSQLSRLELTVAESQPTVSPNLLSFLNEAVTNVENRLPALMRSIKEIKEDWG